jgi:hypothetical protein
MSETVEIGGELRTLGGTIIITSTSKAPLGAMWYVTVTCSITTNTGNILVESGANQKPRVEYLSSTNAFISSAELTKNTNGDWVDQRAINGNPAKAKVYANWVLAVPSLSDEQPIPHP